MTDNGIITIHNKQYMTVAKRIELMLDDAKKAKIEVKVHSEVLQHSPSVVVKAIVTIPGMGEFTGTSAANPSKSIEKQSPYEVAETSAVGRALGFAGYGIIEGIASADEIHKAEAGAEAFDQLEQDIDDIMVEGAGEGTPKPYHQSQQAPIVAADAHTCSTCGAPATFKQGTKNGRIWKGIFCEVNKNHVAWI